MNKEEFIKLYGKRKFNQFHNWMWGQTCGINKKGEPDYYLWDVELFLRGGDCVD